MASGEGRTARPLAARLAQVAGIGLSVAGMVFVVRAIAVRWDGIRGDVAGLSAGWLLGGLIAASAAMTLVAARWRASVLLVGGELDPADTLALYFRGEVAKYVPGGVWAVVGRAELARRRGVPWRVAYASVTLSLVALYAAAAATAGALAPAVLGFSAWGWALWISGALLLGGVLLTGGLAEVARRPALAGRLVVPGPRPLARLVVGYVPAWLLIGTATWCAARSLTGDAPFVDLLFATTVSWLAGFLTVPAPGGIGVREAVFVAVLGPLPGDVTAAVALLARVLFMVTDAVGAVVASVPVWAAPAPSGPGDDERPGQGPEHP